MAEIAATPSGMRWGGRFRRLSQSGQFALSGGLVMLAAMLMSGMVISGIAARATVDSTAASSALFLDSLLSPLVQGLAHKDTVDPDEIAQIDGLLKDGAFADRFAHVEIWKGDGLVAYSTTSDLIGGRFPPPAGLVSALEGEVAAQYTDLNAGEHTIREFATEYLEIYVPLREHHSGRIIAVVEIHEMTQPLKRKLLWVRVQTWLVVSGATLLIGLALFGIVSRSGRLIGEQQVALRNRLEEIERVSDQNRRLRERVQAASSRLAELNERYLRNVGAELHDGPAQLVGLAALKVEQVRRADGKREREAALEGIETVLGDALRDMRVIARGLMLPEIAELSLRETVRHAARAHEQRTATKVAVSCPDIACGIPQAVQICVYRFVQEGLNNAYRHAGGHGQAVECRLDGDVLAVRVRDAGGEPTAGSERNGGGLGLTGLRERVVSLGGTFHTSRGPRGTAMEMSIALGEGGGA